MNGRLKTILEHMLEDVQEAIQFAEAAGDYETYAATPIYRKAVVMSLLNIGELAHHLPKEFTDAFPVVPWRKMTDM
jgi:uncharacterized protein with HEPN domain